MFTQQTPLLPRKILTTRFLKSSALLNRHRSQCETAQTPCYRKNFSFLVIVFIFCSSFSSFVDAAWAMDSWSKIVRPYLINNKTYYQLPPQDSFIQKGHASWYGPAFHGRKTSNGEDYNMHSLTAAHKTLPMDTVLLVKNLDNGKDTFVRINDRGPFVGGRILDLSYKAARELGIVGDGTARVQIVALAEGEINHNSELPTLHLKDLTRGEFYVQIGTFAKKFNADRLQKRFADAGHSTVVNQSLSPKNILYQVHVYAGKTLESAKTAEKALLARGYAGAFVIAK